jgi:hypothetical protein
VRRDIEASLGALVAGRPATHFGAVRSVVKGGVCRGLPTCALVVAVYESEPWSTPEHPRRAQSRTASR